MDRKLLEELFYHGIMPREWCHPHKRAYGQLGSRCKKAETELLGQLPPECMASFAEYKACMDQINTLEEEEHFIQGLALGIRLTAEAFLVGEQEESD